MVKQGLKRETIKYIAVFCMVLNHISYAYYGGLYYLPALFMMGIGYCTAIIMCYFLVEGYEHTHSKTNYLKRLGIFALISQFPFAWGLSQVGDFHLFEPSLNIIVTLFLCFLMLMAWEYLRNQTLALLVSIGVLVASLICDWAILAPVFVMIFYFGKKRGWKIGLQFVLIYLIYFVVYLQGELQGHWEHAIWITLLYSIGPILAFLLIGGCYNGGKAVRFTGFHKWFFYIFYPGHLLVLGLIHHLMG